MPINAFTAGVAALAINSTAFTIEIFRGGFAAVPVAQHDAARALGLRPALIMALVVVPQVFRIVLPLYLGGPARRGGVLRMDVPSPRPLSRLRSTRCAGRPTDGSARDTRGS